MKGVDNMTGKSLLSSLCKPLWSILFIASILCFPLEALTKREKKDIRDFLKFLATHRVVTLGLRASEVAILAEKILPVHPVELACYILGDDEVFGYFCRINQNFFKQQYLYREWSNLFTTGYGTLELDEIEQEIYMAGLDKKVVQDCLDANTFVELWRELLERAKGTG